MYRYLLHLEDGSDVGDVTYAVMIRPGEEILVGNGRRFRVLDVVPFEEEDELPFVGLLKVEVAEGNPHDWRPAAHHAIKLERAKTNNSPQHVSPTTVTNATNPPTCAIRTRCETSPG